MKVHFQNTLVILTVITSFFMFACNKDDEDETVYQEDLFVNVGWVLSSSSYEYDVSISEFAVWPAEREYYTIQSTNNTDSCVYDYVTVFSNDNYVNKITEFSYCDSDLNPLETDHYARWHVVNEEIVVDYEDGYYAEFDELGADTIDFATYEVVSLDDTSCTLQYVLSGDDLEEYLGRHNEPGIYVSGSIVITENYINKNASSFSSL